MRISLGSDHRGVSLVQSFIAQLRGAGHDPVVLGECSGAPCDYPDIAWLVSNSVAHGESDRGILVCGTGIGMCIAANKVDGIRAALASDELAAQLSRSHNNANVLCLSADLIGPILAKRILDVWMSTSFEGGRHERRLAKITRIEHGETPSA
ncbi:MAG: ribose 5-phosphate isomerase B [Planctomycetes bacterium]|nr:ribose 5-phosphate isomerase B [Planctomycetota bacterium]